MAPGGSVQPARRVPNWISWEEEGVQDGEEVWLEQHEGKVDSWREVESPALVRRGSPVLEKTSSAPTKSFVANPQWIASPSRGSRFWALDGEDSSDDEGTCEEEREGGLKVDVVARKQLPQEESFVERALKQGFSSDEILKAGEQLLCAGLSPRVVSCPEKVSKKRNGHLAKHMVETVVKKSSIFGKP